MAANHSAITAQLKELETRLQKEEKEKDDLSKLRGIPSIPSLHSLVSLPSLSLSLHSPSPLSRLL